jgi:hypothetical protein
MHGAIGHNLPQFDFFEFFDLVTGTSASMAEKFIAIVHARQIARKNRTSFLSRAKMLEAVSVSNNTYQRAMPVVRLLLQDTQSRGRATVWEPRFDITAESVEQAILALRTEAENSSSKRTKSMPHGGAYSTEDAPHRCIGMHHGDASFGESAARSGASSGEGMPHGGSKVCTTVVRHKDKVKEEKKEPPIVPQPPEPVWLDADGVPHVANGKREMLEKILGGRADLDATLHAVAAKIDADGDLWGSVLAEVATFAAGLKKKRARQAIPEEYPSDFEAFWKLYPRATGKGDAFKSWQRLSAAQKRKAYESLQRQAPALQVKTRDPKGNLCPHPATWLNQGRFDDPAPEDSGLGRRRPSNPQEMTAAEYQDYLDRGYA